ncbi:tyrosine-type recombinase/integrase [Occallatibacter riparius]|uniref:Tyrosine-type recombinase/integrase n=1 Tax=Occallatibacter riparius TaxID=1002689 RepID=A0A9J7BLW2_9BACT|nr:tyrosine-type recombinase/integrase [Occallatibacter riparius]UWZ83473.1 tyrosine-type recombinase/integrase [Occallatibacter riparius]
MSVKKRGRYFHYEFMLHGQRYWGTTKETNQKRAETFEAIKLAEAQQGALNRKVRKIPTLSEFSKEFLQYNKDRVAAGTLDLDTYKDYCHGWGLLSETIVAGMPLHKITRNLAATIVFPKSPHNAKSGQRTLSRMLNVAAELEYIQAAPKIKRSKAPRRTRVLSPEERAELLKHLRGDVRDVFIVGCDCGTRPGVETMRMKWANIAWERNAVWVIGKGNKQRPIPMSDRLRAVLKRRWAAAQAAIVKAKAKGDLRKVAQLEQWVFVGKTAEGHRRTIGKAFRKARTAAGFGRDIVPYLTRHTFATEILAETKNLALVKDLLGHDSIATTQQYLHPDISGVADVVNQLNVRHSGLELVVNG